MTTPKPALPEPVALIDPRALARGDASLHCITRPEYRSIADADAGVEYVPVYTRAAIDAAVAEKFEALKEELLGCLEEPDSELLTVFQEAFVKQLKKRKHRPGLESAEMAGIRALLKHAVTRERKPGPGVAEARAGWTRECDDTDKLLRGLGLDPERCRTEGGALNVGKTLALLAEARAVSEDIEAIVACLGDDAATLLDDNPECEIAANMIAAAQALEALSATPSPAMPAEQPDTVPWPQVTRYSGGASREGIGGKVWIRLADDGPEVEYVPAEQPKPARVALSDEQINTIRKEHTTGSWIDSHSFARAVIAEYERVNGIAPAQGEQT